MLRVVAPLLAVHKMTAFRAWLAAPLVVLRVTSALTESVVVPATAESNKPVIESLTTVPHVPARSPVVGNAKPSKGEKLVTAIWCSLYSHLDILPSWRLRVIHIIPSGSLRVVHILPSWRLRVIYKLPI